MQPYDSIICGYICIGFIDFMSKAKSLLNYTNLFSPDDYENQKMVYLYLYNYIALFAISIENLKSLKYHTSQKKQFCLLLAVGIKMKVKKYLKKKNQLRH